MKNIAIILILLTCTSCLKKIEEVANANKNIFDSEYAGDQWWVLDDVYLYTNSNNDEFVRFEVTIPESAAPDLKPTNILVGVSVNGGAEITKDIERTVSGDYVGYIDISPMGVTNYCLEMGIHVEEEGITINQFTECRDL